MFGLTSVCTRHYIPCLRNMSTFVPPPPPPSASLLSWTSTRNKSGGGDFEGGEDFHFESRNGKGVFYFNRPKCGNSYGTNCSDTVLKQLEECEKTKSFVILRGKGEHFSGGPDVKFVLKSVLFGNSTHLTATRIRFLTAHKIHNMSIPFISLMNGVAMSSGLLMATFGHYRVATENTICSMPETSLGVCPETGVAFTLLHLQRLGEMGSTIGLYLALTGHQLRGNDTVRAGLATHMCSANKLEDLQAELLALDNVKARRPGEIEKILKHYTNACPDTKRPFSLEPQLSKIDDIFSGKKMEIIMSRLEKDPSEWASRVLTQLRKASPTALKITRRQFKMCRGLTLDQCMTLDYRVYQRIIKRSDFIEGVRSQMVDKDNKPRWNPATLAEVSDEYVNTFFQPLQDGEEDLYIEDPFYYRR